MNSETRGKLVSHLENKEFNKAFHEQQFVLSIVLSRTIF